MDIVERLREVPVNTTHWVKCHDAADEIEHLRQTNTLLSDLFHEAIALPQGVCPRPSTAGDGMFNPHHRALNKEVLE